MKIKGKHKATRGDIVEFDMINIELNGKEKVRGVILEHEKGLLGEDITVVVSLFPYYERRIYNGDYTVIKRYKGKWKEFEVGDLVKLRGTEDQLLYVDQKTMRYYDDEDEPLYNVRELAPKTDRACRFVKSFLLERVK